MVAVSTEPITAEFLKKALANRDYIEIPASIDEFWALVDIPGIRLEYVNKHIIGTMSYGSTPHETIVSNVIFEFRTTFNKGNYRVFGSNRPIRAEICEEIFFPDAHLISGDLREYHYDKSKTASLNPAVIVEVHSKSTRNYDLTDKLDCYKDMPTVQQIVYIESTQPKIRIFNRTSKPERWLEITYSNMFDKVKILNHQIPMTKIFQDVIF